MSRSLFVVALAITLLGASSAQAGRCVGIFFRGFNAPVGTSGMDNLEAHLSGAFAGNPARPFSTGVFNWTGQQAAWDFLDTFNDVDCLVLAGHSFGANAAMEFTTNYLDPAGFTVDVLVQFDSVGVNDDVLPANVTLGINYHQISTGFFEPEGQATVVGSTNIQVEAEYGVSNSQITHTEIDCPLFERSSSAYASLFGSQPDLFARVEGHVAPLFVIPALPSMGLPGGVLLLASLFACAKRGRRRFSSIAASREPLISHSTQT